MASVKVPAELNVALTKYRDDSQGTAAGIAMRTVVALIPYAGGPILELFDGLAQRRVQERLDKVFVELRQCLERLSEESIDRAFFESEEFQSLLFLLLERLHTTQDADKLKMFAHALANSGGINFKADDKEQYIRVLSDSA